MHRIIDVSAVERDINELDQKEQALQVELAGVRLLRAELKKFLDISGTYQAMPTEVNLIEDEPVAERAAVETTAEERAAEGATEALYSSIPAAGSEGSAAAEEQGDGERTPVPVEVAGQETGQETETGQEPPANPSEPAAAGEVQLGGVAADASSTYARTIHLRRDRTNQQTKVAMAVVRNFRPGEVLTATDAAAKIAGVIPHPNSTTPAHHLSSFLYREANGENGILERIEPGRYRVRSNADQLIH